MTVFYQPTLLHVRVSITQLALQTERVCCCCRELAHTRHIFSDVEGLQYITDHPEFVGACRAGERGGGGVPRGPQGIIGGPAVQNCIVLCLKSGMQFNKRTCTTCTDV